MGFNTINLKKVIFDTLKNDSVLIALLDGNENIFHFYPKQESNIPYPIVVYQLLGVEDDVYDNDQNTGVNTALVNIEVFSDSPTMEEADKIADRVYALLNFQSLSNSDVITYSCLRKSQTEIYDETAQVWRITAQYELTNAAK